GCLFVKACAEFQDPTHPVHQQSCAHQAEGIAYYRNLADAAGFADPDEIARNIWFLAQGAIVAAVMAAIENPAGSARDAAEKMLACAERRSV
ncbi:MAG: TetR/AcrR family transcriptional regulator, partial [Halocynthiibacter sp.]